MPEIGVIQKPGLFEDILRRLGVNRPTRPFTLDGNILPVILVDSGVSFVASPTPAYGVNDIFTEGTISVPGAAAILADTGPLPVGSYSLFVLFGSTEIARVQFQWRDVPNTASLYDTELISPNDTYVPFTVRLEISNANERFRIITAVASTGGQAWGATIMAKL